MQRPVSISKTDIISAWVGRKPKILYVVFTLISSIKKRSIPVKTRYIEKITPGIVIFFLIVHKKRKRKEHIMVS